MATLGILGSVKLLSDVRANGGQWVANVPVDTGRPPRLRTRLDGFWRTHHLTAQVVATWAGAALLVPGRVLELNFIAPVSSHEFRILDTTDSEPGDLIALTAVGIEFDLQRRSMSITDTVNGVLSTAASDGGITPTVALASRVIAHGPSYVVLDTVTPTGAISASYPPGAMPWDAGSAIAQAVKDQLQQLYELQLVRNGTVNYRLQFVQVGAGAPAADVRSRKNLLRLERIVTGDGQATRAQVLDGSNRPLVGRNLYLVDAVNPGVHVDIADIGGAAGPAAEADQYNGLVLVDDGGVEHAITDTQVLSPTLTRFLTSTTAGLVAGELVRIMRPGKMELQVIDSPARQADFGVIMRSVRAPQLDPGTNVLGANTDVATWSAGVPVGWVSAGPGSIAQNTTDFITGGRSATITCAASTQQGLYKEIVYYALYDQTVIVSVWTMVPTDAHSVNRTEIRITVNTVAVAGSPVAIPNPPRDVWVRTDHAVALVAGARTIRVQVQNLSGLAAAVVHCDAAQVLNLDEVRPFRVGSHPARAIQRANSLFLTHGYPVDAYRVRVSDEARRDPVRFPFDGFEFGAGLRVRAAVLGVDVTPRVLSIDQNLLDPRDTAVELNVIRPEFVHLTALR